MDKIKQNLLPLSLISLFLVTASLGGYMYYRYDLVTDELARFRKDPQTAVALEVIEKVSKLVILPKDEQPTIATITDVEKLQNQPFFKLAQNGDKLLVYSQANRTILYRPSNDKVIETMTLSIENLDELKKRNTTTPAENVAGIADKDIEEIEIDEPVSVTIYNGTKIVGQATLIADNLEESFDEFELDIVLKADASQIYTNTQVIALTDNGNLALEDIIGFVGTEENELPSELPKEEIIPETDILIIVGEDY